MLKSEDILFLSSLGLYSDEISYLIARYEEPLQAFKEGLLNEKIAQERKFIKKYTEKKDDFDSYRNFMENNNISYLTVLDEDFPEALREIDDCPAILYYKGRADFSRLGIGVVGARKCTDYGVWACKKIVSELDGYGVSVISGLALGIDKTAHDTALDNGIFTIGVLGCGIDRVYPASNRKTFARMEEEGCILSEFPLGANPLAHHFPIRNRIISGLSKAVLVIEAQEKSGTLITAGFAADQGRDVFALPGNINSLFSQGTNRLIKDGAKIVRCGEDIIEEYPQLAELKKEAEKISMDLSLLDPTDKAIYEYVLLQPRDTDEIARQLDLEISQALSRLTLMELRGFLIDLNGKWNIN